MKRHNAGRFPFFVPALVFHAWAIDGLIGLLWAAAQGRKGLKLLRLGLGKVWENAGNIRFLLGFHWVHDGLILGF